MKHHEDRARMALLFWGVAIVVALVVRACS